MKYVIKELIESQLQIQTSTCWIYLELQ
jgi:hypothetical protein